MVSLNEEKSVELILKTRTHAGFARSQLRHSEDAFIEKVGIILAHCLEDNFEILVIIGSRETRPMKNITRPR